MKYNALDIPRLAAELAVQVHLDAENLSASIEYNQATDSSYWDSDFDADDSQLQARRELVTRLRDLCGDEEWQRALSAVGA